MYSYNIVMIFAGMQMGYIVACMNGLEELFEAKFDIGESTRDLWQSLFGSSGVFGLAVGSMSSGFIMKNGRKKTLIISSLIGIAGVAMQQIPTMATIIIGRVIYGIATGIYSVAVGRYIEETVPHQLLTVYSPIYLCGTSLAKLMVFMINAGLPEDHEREKLIQSEYWRVIKMLYQILYFNSQNMMELYQISLLGLPMVLFTIVLLGTIFVIKHDTPKFLIINKRHDEAILAISQIYHKDENPQEIFDHLSKNSSKKTDKIAVNEALFGVQYRMATIVMFSLVIFHEFSGYASIILYSKKIFKSMQPSALTPKQQVQINKFQKSFLDRNHKLSCDSRFSFYYQEIWQKNFTNSRPCFDGFNQYHNRSCCQLSFSKILNIYQELYHNQHFKHNFYQYIYQKVCQSYYILDSYIIESNILFQIKDFSLIQNSIKLLMNISLYHQNLLYSFIYFIKNPLNFILINSFIYAVRQIRNQNKKLNAYLNKGNVISKHNINCQLFSNNTTLYSKQYSEEMQCGLNILLINNKQNYFKNFEYYLIFSVYQNFTDQDMMIVSFIITFCATYQIFNGPIIWMQTKMNSILNSLKNYQYQFIVKVYLSEVAVDQALAFTFLALWLAYLVIGISTPFMFTYIGVQGVFFMFGIISLLAAVFCQILIIQVYFFLKETRGLNDKEKKMLYAPKQKE